MSDTRRPRVVIKIDYDPTNPAHTAARLTAILREQADVLDHSVWSLGPGDHIQIRDPETREICGFIYHDRYGDDS